MDGRPRFRIKLNNELCLPGNASTLFCARGEGEDIIMANSDRNAQEAEKLRTYQRDRDLQRRGVKIDDAIQGLSDEDRKMIINKSLRKVNSALSVS